MKSIFVFLFLCLVFFCIFSFEKKNEYVNKEDGRRKESFCFAEGRKSERKSNRKNEQEQKNERERQRIKGSANTGRLPENNRKLYERKAGENVTEREKKFMGKAKEEEKVSFSNFDFLKEPTDSSSFEFSFRHSFVPPPRLMRFPYRQSSDEILRFPDSVGLGVGGEPSSEEVEVNSGEIANAVNIQMKKLNKGRVMIALTDLTHPLHPFNENSKDYLIYNSNNNQYNTNFMNDNNQFNDYDIENDLSLLSDDNDSYFEEEKIENKTYPNNAFFDTTHEKKFKERRKNEEFKRIQQLRENIRTELNIDMLKMEGIVREARLLDNIGLLLIDFDENAKEEQIKETLKRFWYLNKGIWLIEADADITFRRRSDFYEVLDEDFIVEAKKKEDLSFEKKREASMVAHHNSKVENNNGNSDNESKNDAAEMNGSKKFHRTRKGAEKEDIFVEDLKEDEDNYELNEKEMLEDALKYYYADFFLQNSSSVQPANTLNYQIFEFHKFLADSMNSKANLNKLKHENSNKYQENMNIKAAVEDVHHDISDLKSNYSTHKAEDGASEREITQGNLETPNDSYFQYQWGLYNKESRIDIRFLEAWRLTKNMPKTPVVVAHIDTGIDFNHSDLSDKIWKNEDEILGNGIDDDGNGYTDDVYGWNFEGGNMDIRDKHGHGTHTAGILGAITNNNNGISGISDSVKIMVLKFHNMASDAVAAIEYSLKKKAFATTNSWGFSAPVESLRLAIEKAKSHGQLFICAVDNSGSDNTWYGDYPPNWQIDNMIRVASLTSKGILDRTSNYGRNNVDLAAPGRNILSTVPSYIYNNKHYAYKDGTSMATPFVAGVAALLKSIKPNLTANEIRNAIMSSVTVLKSLNNKVISRGMLNAENAVKHVLGMHYVRNQELDVPISYYDRYPSLIFPYSYGLTSLLTKLRFNLTSNEIKKNSEETYSNDNVKRDAQNNE